MAVVSSEETLWFIVGVGWFTLFEEAGVATDGTETSWNKVPPAGFATMGS